MGGGPVCFCASGSVEGRGEDLPHPKGSAGVSSSSLDSCAAASKDMV